MKTESGISYKATNGHNHGAFIQHVYIGSFIQLIGPYTQSGRWSPPSGEPKRLSRGANPRIHDFRSNTLTHQSGATAQPFPSPSVPNEINEVRAGIVVAVAAEMEAAIKATKPGLAGKGLDLEAALAAGALLAWGSCLKGHFSRKHLP